MSYKYFKMPVLLLMTCFIAMGFMKPEDKSTENLVPAELSAVLETYKKAAIAQDATTLVGLAHPSFYKLATKEKLIESLKESYANKQAPTIKGIIFDKPDPERAYSGGVFRTVSYNMYMTLPRPGDATPQIDKMMIEMIGKAFGAETKIEIDEKNSLIVISYVSKILGLQDKEQGWTLLDFDQFEMLAEKKMLPEDLVKLVKGEEKIPD